MCTLFDSLYPFLFPPITSKILMKMQAKQLLWESKLAIALLFLILARCVDRVLYTRITFDYTAFLWYFSNAILPIAFIITSWPVVWYKMYFTDHITKEMKQFPHYKFAIMALFDTLFNLLSAFPTPHIGGNLANVLNQLNLPINMLLAYLVLNTRFRRNHILGSILVLYGGLVDMIPIFTGSIPANMPDPTFGWIMLYLISLIPNSVSNVYKEIGLKGVDLDIWYANAWISFYQFLLGLLSIWTIRIRAFSDPPVPWSDFPSYLYKGGRCFIGEPVKLNGNDLPCNAGVLQVFFVFIIFNMIYNQLMLYIFKEGSSVLFVVSSAICLPLTDLLYMFPILTGRLAGQQFTIYDGFALFVLVIGLLVYHSEKVQRSAGNQCIEKSPMYTSPTMEKTHLMGKLGRDRVVYRQSPRVFRKTKSSEGSLLRNERNERNLGLSSVQGYGAVDSKLKKKGGADLV